MIQRIQTLYFFSAALVLSLFSFFCDANVLHLAKLVITAVLPAVTSLIVAFLSLILIFLFKNRNAQSKLSSFIMLLIIMVIAYFIYYFGAMFYQEWTFYLLPLAFLLILLGRKNVQKDEKLVKSVDRLR